MDDSKEKQQKILPLSYGLGLVKELVPVPTHIFKSDNHYYEKFDREEVDEWNVLKTDYEFRKKILKEVKKKTLSLSTMNSLYCSVELSVLMTCF